uniref:Uncharacterized protein n=1 Tax=Anguilla anguilla TaxID=7936 RepID=A0A0E9W9Y7_ANGAN
MWATGKYTIFLSLKHCHR